MTTSTLTAKRKGNPQHYVEGIKTIKKPRFLFVKFLRIYQTTDSKYQATVSFCSLSAMCPQLMHPCTFANTVSDWLTFPYQSATFNRQRYIYIHIYGGEYFFCSVSRNASVTFVNHIKYLLIPSSRIKFGRGGGRILNVASYQRLSNTENKIKKSVAPAAEFGFC